MPQHGRRKFCNTVQTLQEKYTYSRKYDQYDAEKQYGFARNGSLPHHVTVDAYRQNNREEKEQIKFDFSEYGLVHL